MNCSLIKHYISNKYHHWNYECYYKHEHKPGEFFSRT